MKPSIEEIKQAIPAYSPDDQIVIVEEEEVRRDGFVEALVIRIRDFTVKLFRLLKMKKVIFVVVMSIAALEGIQVTAPIETERTAIFDTYQNTEVWVQNIASNHQPMYENKYYVFGAPPNPSPMDPDYQFPHSTVFAPITGSAIVRQDLPFNTYDTGWDITYKRA